MKIFQLFEANIASKLKDPKLIKLLAIAMRHDHTIPRAALARLGPRPTDTNFLELWSTLLDNQLSQTEYGDVSRDGKFDDWITRLYISTQIAFEELAHIKDSMGAWKMLSIRGLLKPPDQDFTKFKTTNQMYAITRKYAGELEKIQQAIELEKHKRDKKEVTIINNKHFLVTIPMNYGACYTFNFGQGYPASYCTGSSNGLRWFDDYSARGTIISVIDKTRPNDPDGKWQIHAAKREIRNAPQKRDGDRLFATEYPGLMNQIIAAMEEHAAEIQSASEDLVSGGYDVSEEINKLRAAFPLSCEPLNGAVSEGRRSGIPTRTRTRR